MPLNNNQRMWEAVRWLHLRAIARRFGQGTIVAIVWLAVALAH